MNAKELIKELTELCENIHKIVINLRKDGPNRKRSKERAQEKILTLQNLYTTFKNIVKELGKLRLSELENIEAKNIATNIEKYKDEALTRIRDSIEVDTNQKPVDKETNKEEVKDKEKSQSSNSQKTNDKENKIIINLPLIQKPNNEMATFDFNIAQKLPIFNASNEEKRSEELRDFLNTIEFYHETLAESSKKTLIKFLLKCKIQGRALTELGSSVPDTLLSLKNLLIEKCGPKETLETIQARLSRLKQGNRTIREYTTELENLVTKMIELEVTAQGEESRQALKESNERRGLAFLKNGIPEKYKIVLMGARHTQFQEAIKHLLEIDGCMENKPENLYYVEDKNFNRNFRTYNYSQYNSNGNKFNHQNNNHSSNNFPRNRDNFTTQRFNQNFRGNTNQNMNLKRYNQNSNLNKNIVQNNTNFGGNSRGTNFRGYNSSYNNRTNYNTSNNQYNSSRNNYNSQNNQNRAYNTNNSRYANGGKSRVYTIQEENSQPAEGNANHSGGEE